MPEPITTAPPAAPKPKPERKALGRNQRIAVVGYAGPLLVTLALTLIALVQADADPARAAVLSQWMGHVSSYVPAGMLIILGVSGGIKTASTVADALKARKA